MREISSILMGGVGNYMLQVAAAYAYAKRYDMHVGFNCSESMGQHQHVTTYDNNIFKDVDLYYIPKGGDRAQLNENGYHYTEIANNYPNRNILRNTLRTMRTRLEIYSCHMMLRLAMKLKSFLRMRIHVLFT